jgi:hypothetical protein
MNCFDLGHYENCQITFSSMLFRILALMHVSLCSTIGEANESMGNSAVHATRIMTIIH